MNHGMAARRLVITTMLLITMMLLITKMLLTIEKTSAMNLDYPNPTTLQS